ncbi:TnsA endonuclease N-terminal domain-containing protein [Pseudoalteromonas sp. XMcav1-K]|uniref:TnsA endonuclease N-terminal domain-containing protein n=1 Tax=Pseudoalteromonas sp. XMcav1-K TaxID=3374372 RepID=UPI0037576704
MKVKINKASKIIKDWLKPLSKGTYEPIIKVWSGPKGTRRHFFNGMKDRRKHHFLSDGERRFGIYHESLPRVLDYYEQFPLWDIELAIKTAHEMGIRYPMDSDGEAYVMTTDLFAREYNQQLNKIEKVAYSYKPLASLDFESKHPVSVNRTLAKIELERRYYEKKNIRFKLVTDAHISKMCAKNLLKHRACANFKHEFIEHEERFINEFMNIWFAYENPTVNEILRRVKPKLVLPKEDLISLFDWGIWTHQIPADLETEINPFRPLVMKEVV